MNPVIEYCADYRARELKSGRNPKTIRLTKYQHEVLIDWAEANLDMIPEDKQPGREMIMGMEIIEV